jgi:hypothetical protein
MHTALTRRPTHHCHCSLTHMLLLLLLLLPHTTMPPLHAARISNLAKMIVTFSKFLLFHNVKRSKVDNDLIFFLQKGENLTTLKKSII